jgi:uncharacterized membrane protein YdbT with pleckstrin-like domain
MEDRTIRPSIKTVRAAYALAIVLALAGVWAICEHTQDSPRWLCFLPLIVLLFPLNMHLRRQAVTLRFHDGHLTLESGYLSRTRRTLDMAKIQDVTVQQTFGQRLIGVGDLMLESAGESGAMAIRNLDRPREIADEIIAASKRA